ncbi:uncharacterized protein A4U43_C02F3100 [Asparagus officinalis]|uniref:Uncharacterized protein n=1 Tax=Asparagus officinalis TaxID=4686 RepID=A0A5P1FKJ0_ASPOF|nr:uncharacterized protein LOC109829363 [Asparagus officinalis]ONK77100.1 uncharacterized protein A4U43_C02F3100 [Asparagus officinalis]
MNDPLLDSPSQQAPPALELNTIKDILVRSFSVFGHKLCPLLTCATFLLIFRLILTTTTSTIIDTINTNSSIQSFISSFFDNPQSKAINVCFSDHCRDVPQIVYILVIALCIKLFLLIAYLIAYQMVIGTAFFAVSEYYVGQVDRLECSTPKTIFSGVRIGAFRLKKFLFLLWFLRQSLILLLCHIVLGDGTLNKSDMVSFATEAMLMSYTYTAPIPIVSTTTDKLATIRIAWGFLESVLLPYILFVPSVLVMGNVGLGFAVREGSSLGHVVSSRDLVIKIHETIVCGAIGANVWFYVLGTMFAKVFMAIAEVYFLVMYIVLFLSAKMKEREEGDQEGRRFGHVDLQMFVDCWDVKHVLQRIRAGGR